MSVGITGTREGMTPLQLRGAIRLIAGLTAGTATIRYRPTRDHEYHHLIHGDCVGADAQAWAIADAAGWDTTALPSTTHERWHANTSSTEIEQRRPSLERNRLIVERCDLLIAFPKAVHDQSGGTWYTINHAREAGKHLLIVWPDGSTTEDNR